VFGVVVFKKDNRGLQIKTMHLFDSCSLDVDEDNVMW